MWSFLSRNRYGPIALDLGAVPVGGFDDAAVAKALELPEGQEVCYLIPVGHPG